MRKTYPCDLSREAFEEIRPLLDSVRKQTKHRSVDLYDVFSGVLYGCQWRMLPSEYPKKLFTISRTTGQPRRNEPKKRRWT